MLLIHSDKKLNLHLVMPSNNNITKSKPLYPFSKRLLWVPVFIALFNACTNPPDFSEVPEIEFVSVNKVLIHEQQDSINLVFSFKDGDGDLGVNQSDTSSNTFITDIRSGKKPFTYLYRLPYVSSKGSIKAISGQVSINIPGVTCVPGKTIDTILYRIQIIDRAGHYSNIIESEKIVVICE